MPSKGVFAYIDNIEIERDRGQKHEKNSNI